MGILLYSTPVIFSGRGSNRFVTQALVILYPWLTVLGLFRNYVMLILYQCEGWSRVGCVACRWCNGCTALTLIATLPNLECQDFSRHRSSVERLVAPLQTVGQSRTRSKEPLRKDKFVCFDVILWAMSALIPSGTAAGLAHTSNTQHPTQNHAANKQAFEDAKERIMLHIKRAKGGVPGAKVKSWRNVISNLHIAPPSMVEDLAQWAARLDKQRVVSGILAEKPGENTCSGTFLKSNACSFCIFS